jgi:hypothetical protein
MSKECSKFTVIYSRAVSIEHSGWNEQKYEKHAMELYATAEEADFLKEKKHCMKEGEEKSAYSRDEFMEVLESMESGESEHEVQEEQQPPKNKISVAIHIGNARCILNHGYYSFLSSTPSSTPIYNFSPG